MARMGWIFRLKRKRELRNTSPWIGRPPYLPHAKTHLSLAWISKLEGRAKGIPHPAGVEFSAGAIHISAALAP